MLARMKKKMTDNEIIKALKKCSIEKETCNGCPFDKDGCISENGINLLMKSALDLINRQKAEILELQKRIINWRADMDYRPDEIKSEAIKEFAEKLKTETFLAKAVESVEHVIWMNEIDNIVKEMTEVQE